MPKKYIQFPDPIEFYDPYTKERVTKDGKKDGKPDTMDFGEFLQVLMSNPLWNEGYAQSQAQDEILRSYEEAINDGADGMWIADEDHKFLEKAVKEPKCLIFGPSGQHVLPGFGKHPSMARQFLKMQEAVMKAVTESERERAAEKAKKEAEKAKKEAADKKSV